MNDIFIYSLKSSLVLTMLYLPYMLMLRKESFFRMNRIILLSILFFSLILPVRPASNAAQGSHGAEHDNRHARGVTLAP